MKARATLAVISISYIVLFYAMFKSPFRIDDQALLCLLGPIYRVSGLVLILIDLIAVFRYKTTIPFIAFLLGAIIVWYMPQITPEELYFAMYKPDYEHVVEMAREHQLEHGGDCSNAFARPPEYEHLTWRDCIYVSYLPALTVEFDPKRYSPRILVYAETRDAVEADASCDGDEGWIIKQINDYWYVCYQTWN